MLDRYHTERMIRGVILLAASAFFTLVAVLLGASRVADKNWTYLFILLVVGAAFLVSRYGTRWVMRRIGASKSGASPGAP